MRPAKLAARLDVYADLLANPNPSPADLRVALARVIANSDDPDTALEDAARRLDFAEYGEVVSEGRQVSWVSLFGDSPGRLRGALVVVALIADTEGGRAATLNDLVRMAGLSPKLARQHAAELCETGYACWDRDGLRVVCPVTPGLF